MSSATAEREHKCNSDSDTDIDGHTDSQGPEPTNRDIMRLLHTINASLHSKLEVLGDGVEQLQGEVLDLQEENKKLRKETGECRQREADKKGLGDEAKM